MSHHQARLAVRRKHLVNLMRTPAAATCDVTAASYTPGTNVAPDPTVAIDTTTSSHGMKCVKITSNSTGFPFIYVAAPADGAAVTVGSTYTAAVAAKVATGTVVSGAAHITWFTAGGSFISGTDGSSATISSGAWTILTVTAVAPATAAQAVPQFTAPTEWVSGDAIYLDDWAIYAGSAGTPWSSP
jgi:hypothetical protein